MLLEKKLIKSDVEANNNKFWTGIINDDFTVSCLWGRIGNESSSIKKTFFDEKSAKKFLDKKVSEKINKGYNELKTIDTKVHVNFQGSLSEIATTQIITDNDTKSLIQYLIKVNVHNILSSTTMTFQEDTGLFATPLGIVTQNSIDRARILLNQIFSYVETSQFINKDYIKLLNEYLMIIPQKIRKRLSSETLFTKIDDIKKQNDILDALEVSYKLYLDKSNELKNKKSEIKELPKIFSCEINKINDQKEISRIKKKFFDTLNSKHVASCLKPKTIYSIKIDSMQSNFKEKSLKINNIKELWHGTKASNLLSILKSGLIVPPKSNPNVTGRMFGDGLYFSDQSTKALNYSYGYWGGSSRDTNCFMFIADVSMGKEYVAKSSSESFPKNGYDSTFAKSGYSGVQNNEMIVYNTHQVNLKYLIEFEK